MQISSYGNAACTLLHQRRENVRYGTERSFNEEIEADRGRYPARIPQNGNHDSAWLAHSIRCAPMVKQDETDAWEDIDTTGAVSLAEREEEGEFLGITMVPEEGETVVYGMRATLLYRSDPDNPVVQVSSNSGGRNEIYNVEINKVNPENATQLEMFALLSYTDQAGLTDGGVYGSYQQMKVYAMNAGHNGYCEDLSGTSAFVHKKIDWTAILAKIMKDYLEGGIHRQYENCKKLIYYFETVLAERDGNRKKDLGAATQSQAAGRAGRFLTAETTSCTYPADKTEEEIRYITWYTEEGIFCRKEGQKKGYEWSIAFEKKEQYEQAVEFVGRFSSDWNLRFAANENFWNDFLSDGIDLEGFLEFLDGTRKGIPDYAITVGDSVRIDEEKAVWAKYMSPPGAKFYSAAQMHQMEMERIVANTAKMPGIMHWEEY